MWAGLCLAHEAGQSTGPEPHQVSQVMCSALQVEARRFLQALHHKAHVRGNRRFSMSELCSIADTLDLNVPDTPAFVAELNEAGVPGADGVRSKLTF